MSVAGHKTEISEMLDQFCLRAAKLTQTRTPIWSAYVKILRGRAARVKGGLVAEVLLLEPRQLRPTADFVENELSDDVRE